MNDEREQAVFLILLLVVMFFLGLLFAGCAKRTHHDVYWKGRGYNIVSQGRATPTCTWYSVRRGPFAQQTYWACLYPSGGRYQVYRWGTYAF